jgi:hypothetical protein
MSDLFSASVANEYFYILPICNLLPYNSGSSTGGVVGNVAGTNPLSTTITIPDYIKNLEIDYISFGANPAGAAVLPSQLCVAQLVYSTGDTDFKVYNSSDTLVSLSTASEYIVEIRVRNGELLPIDIKNITRIQASTSSASTNNLATPTNITLWKRFIKSASTNKNTYMVDNKLPAGPNATV